MSLLAPRLLRASPRPFASPHLPPYSLHKRVQTRPSPVTFTYVVIARRNMATGSEIPKTMRAVWIEKTGGTEVLQYREDVPVPEPKEGEVLVKNEFLGINYIDT
jgi:hypothetical protein